MMESERSLSQFATGLLAYLDRPDPAPLTMRGKPFLTKPKRRTAKQPKRKQPASQVIGSARLENMTAIELIRFLRLSSFPARSKKATINAWLVIPGHSKNDISTANNRLDRELEAGRLRRSRQIIAESDPAQLRAMPYEDFLDSDYWQAVRRLVLKRDRHACTKCAAGPKAILQVHHRTYQHHGQEHLFLGDLATLCRQCHKKEHKRLPVRPKARKPDQPR